MSIYTKNVKKILTNKVYEKRKNCVIILTVGEEILESRIQSYSVGLSGIAIDTKIYAFRKGDRVQSSQVRKRFCLRTVTHVTVRGTVYIQGRLYLTNGKLIHSIS